MDQTTEQTITDDVLAAMRPPDPRLHELLRSLVRHLHEFAREVALTEGELMRGLEFLTRVGQKSDAQRQEFVLLSDVLGLSILVDAITNRAPAEATASTVFGPFWSPDAPRIEPGDWIARGRERDQAEHAVVHGLVTSLGGAPLKGATLDIWQASPDGKYDVQDPDQPAGNLRGILRTADDGSYWFRTVVPAPYPIPDDGPVGELLEALGRHPMRPAHIHFMVHADGHHKLITHVFPAGDPYLDSDAVFGVKDALVLPFTRVGDLSRAKRYDVRSPFVDVQFDIALTPG